MAIPEIIKPPAALLLMMERERSPDLRGSCELGARFDVDVEDQGAGTATISLLPIAKRLLDGFAQVHMILYNVEPPFYHHHWFADLDTARNGTVLRDVAGHMNWLSAFIARVPARLGLTFDTTLTRRGDKSGLLEISKVDEAQRGNHIIRTWIRKGKGVVSSALVGDDGEHVEMSGSVAVQFVAWGVIAR
ncbi:hypothetical protein B0H34DRAFT_673761 [Crassisporium funariophilum]|nr:hypothetical protein B0H34DRAFT_673761 [Crassisporium funariophilum]